MLLSISPPGTSARATGSSFARESFQKPPNRRAPDSPQFCQHPAIEQLPQKIGNLAPKAKIQPQFACYSVLATPPASKASSSRSMQLHPPQRQVHPGQCNSTHLKANQPAVVYILHALTQATAASSPPSPSASCSSSSSSASSDQTASKKHSPPQYPSPPPSPTVSGAKDR